MIKKEELQPAKFPADRPLTMEPRIAIQLLRTAEKMTGSNNVDKLYLARALAERVLEHGGDIYIEAHDLIIGRVELELPDAWAIFWETATKPKSI